MPPKVFDYYRADLQDRFDAQEYSWEFSTMVCVFMAWKREMLERRYGSQ